MTFTSPLDIAITAILLVRRFGLGRVLLLSPVIVPLFMWSLPPQSCGCIRMPFALPRHAAACLPCGPEIGSPQPRHAARGLLRRYADHYEYSDDFEDLGFVASVDVTVLVSSASNSGWKATAMHAGLDPDEGCEVSVGSETPATAGAIVCTN